MKLTQEVRKFLADAGRKGGSSKSLKKQEAVRENGKLGGRPKGSKNVIKSKEPKKPSRSKRTSRKSHGS